MIQLILFTVFIAFLFIVYEDEIHSFCSKLFGSQERHNRNSFTTMSIICTICQDFLTERPEGLGSQSELETIATRCGHLYHLMCIENWFRSQGRHECPICKTVIDRLSFLSIYPSGDEQSGEIAAKMKKAGLDSEENVILKGELNQFSMILEEMGQNLQEEKSAHDQLKFEFAQRLSEIDELQRQSNENHKMKELTERNWMEVNDKTSTERNEAFERIEELENKLMYQKASMEKRQKEKVAELYLNNSNLQFLNDEYLSQIEQLKNECKLKDLKQSTSKQNFKTNDVETQTDDKDLLSLRSRWLMYKTCMRHMENELQLLEQECCDVQTRQESQQSSINFPNEANAAKENSSLNIKEETQDQVNDILQETDSVEDGNERSKKTLSNEELVATYNTLFSMDSIEPVGIDV